MDCIVHEVTKSWTQLSDFHLFYEPQGSSVLYYVTGFPSIFRLNNIPWYMHCILLICSFICRWTFGSLLFLSAPGSPSLSLCMEELEGSLGWGCH